MRSGVVNYQTLLISKTNPIYRTVSTRGTPELGQNSQLRESRRLRWQPSCEFTPHSAVRGQRLIPPCPNFPDRFRHATPKWLALPEPLHQYVSNQCTKRLKQYAVQRL